MSHPEYTQEELDALAFYALGLLEDDERSNLDEHLRAGCIHCESQLLELQKIAAYVIGYGTPLLESPIALRTRILAATENSRLSPPPVQIWKHWNAATVELHQVVRAGEGEWNDIQPGISVKKLYVDPERDTVTMLIRMSPGTSYGRHVHAGAEQCFVLEGDLCDGETVVTAGDYQCLPAGSTHGRQITKSGCLLLIVSSLHDELLD